MLRNRSRSFCHWLPKVVVLVLVLVWTDTAYATGVNLLCQNFQGSVQASGGAFSSTSGGCSTGVFTGTINGSNGVINVQLANNGDTISHHHDVLPTGLNWLVSTLVVFRFDVTSNMQNITLQTSASPSLEETFLNITGPSGNFYFLGGNWQTGGWHPEDTIPLGGNTLELLPGTYSGIYRFATWTGGGHKVTSVSLAIDATIIPEPNTALLLSLGLVGIATKRRRLN
jgi:hypothetical protein